MERHEHECTGEHCCKTDKTLRIRLNNVKVTKLEIERFIYFWQLSPILIMFPDRKTKVRYGTAFIEQKRILIYRHSAGVCLHEIAHIYTGKPGHGEDFAKILDFLVKLWYVWKYGLKRGLLRMPT